jgi:hypothetical protein
VEDRFNRTKTPGVVGRQVFEVVSGDGTMQNIDPPYVVVSLQEVEEDTPVDGLAMGNVESFEVGQFHQDGQDLVSSKWEPGQVNNSIGIHCSFQCGCQSGEVLGRQDRLVPQSVNLGRMGGRLSD